MSQVGLLFLAGGLLGGLGHLAVEGALLGRLDDADSDGLSHVTDGETAERGVRLVRLDAHGLGRDL